MRTAGKALLAILLVALAGCTGIVHQRYALTPSPNECQATETRPTWMSTVVGVVCWDANGRPIGMAGGTGTSAASVTTSLIGSAAAVAGPVAGAAILGGKIVDAAKVLDGSTVNAVTSGTVKGTVSVGKIPPITISPATGTLKLKVP